MTRPAEISRRKTAARSYRATFRINRARLKTGGIFRSAPFRMSSYAPMTILRLELFSNWKRTAGPVRRMSG